MKKNFLLLAFVLLSCNIYSQIVGIKSNLLYDATTSLNLGVEVALDSKLTLDISGNYNPWEFNGNKQFKHWLVQPEGRYWFGSAFKGHYVGVHLHGGQMNLGHVGFGDHALREHYRQGWFYGCGVGYGYQWSLSRNWRMEVGLGLGYTRFDYDEYGCSICGGRLGEGSKNYWGVTRISLSVIYSL